MDYPIQVPVTNFAQLALDIYDDPDADNLRTHEFNKDWVKIHTWTSPNQFHASFYKNILTNIGVLAIRGTVTSIKGTIDADKEYAKAEFSSKDMPQFKDTITYFNFLKNFHYWKETKEL